MSDRTDQHGHRCDTGYFDRTLCTEPCDMMHSYCTRCGTRQDRCAWADAPAVPPSGDEQTADVGFPASDLTEPQAGTQGFLVRHSGVGPAQVYSVTLGPAVPWTPPEPEPSVADRLRTLADADIEAAKHGSRTERAAAKAAARAYRLAADMIEEEA